MSPPDPGFVIGGAKAPPRLFPDQTGGHPRGVLLVAFVELWERFSFFGVTGLLILFLTGSSAAGGWGWPADAALRFTGWYTGVLMMSPLLGGWLAGRHLSERACIKWGAILVTVGHVFFLLSYLLPTLLGTIHHIDIASLLQTPGLRLGGFSPGASDIERVTLALDRFGPHSTEVTLHYFRQAYGLNSALFYLGMAFLLAGTALIKPTVSSIISSFYRRDDPRRNEGFQLLYMGLYAGCFLGLTVPGLVADRIGWQYGFSVAGAGMLVGLLSYLSLQRTWLGGHGQDVQRRIRAAPGSRAASGSTLLYLAHGAFTIVYIALSYQTIGAFSLYVENDVDRNLLGLDVPATWIQSVSVISFLFSSPLLVLLWRRLDKVGMTVSATHRSAVALAVLTVSLAIFAAVVGLASPGGKPSLLWFVAPYFLIGLGDALLLPSQIALVTRLAGPGREALLVSGWFVFVGLGVLASGYLGAWGLSLPMGTFLGGLTAAAFLSGAAYFASSRRLDRSLGALSS
jgi:proton-dependent oligopeptide transporter, POT family